MVPPIAEKTTIKPDIALCKYFGMDAKITELILG